MIDYTYNRYWARDVVSEMRHSEHDDKAVDWVLRWMSSNWLEPELSSIIQMADEMRTQFARYLLVRGAREAQAEMQLQ